MTLKRSISQRIRQTLIKTRTKLSGGGGGASDEGVDDQVQYSTQVQNQYSPARQNSATGSEGSMDFPMMANAPIYTQVTSNSQNPTPIQGGVQATGVVPSNRKRSGSYARARNVSIHSSQRNSVMDTDSDSFKSIMESTHSYEPNDEVVLLPLGPNEQQQQSQQQYSQSHLPLVDVSTIPMIHATPPPPLAIAPDFPQTERPSLSLQNPSLTTSSTISQSSTTTSPVGTGRISVPSVPPTLNGTPATSSSTTNTLATTITTSTQPDEVETVHANMDPIFIKAHQIDHLDKSLDVEQNDLLAEQMALNILHNISEEAVDELSKLKEEISLKI